MLLCTHVFFSFVSVLRECKNVELSFSDVTCKSDLLKDSRKGTIYLTPYRVRAPDCSRHHRCVFGHISVTVLSCPWRSWCLWIATPRTAWAQPCSPITWWKAAASSSPSLQPTTLKGHCPLSLVVCVPLLLLADLNGCIFVSCINVETRSCFGVRFYALVMRSLWM